MLTIERYRKTRFWGLYDAGELLCVTVYKKGARAVKDRLERQKHRLARQKHRVERQKHRRRRVLRA